ncbi:uncharacterized protein FOMMEDRAFT_81119 [Fomitiporia mediterranea MF3/22]|uniref:uncharacterized protein n=1 Tax=Fomitiporia mediterranea (strain MF3/22) TaxID=694068 RepID=UPI0004408BA3|nr:uncharacterized protein FOMMEDRAFT_81119 [Fomitiporia mediterranea MF3/22]EJD05074.1 hypothetical protein FOMMEDRAFT_81119 [Fomitiporia mediterranea MF3/22]
MSGKDEIKRQIAALQAKLAEAPDSPPAKKRRTDPVTVLAPSTPSRKKNTTHDAVQKPTDLSRKVQRTQQSKCPNVAQGQSTTSRVALKQDERANSSTPATFISQLKSINSNKGEGHERAARTDGFEEKPALAPTNSETTTAPVRDDRLAIVEDLVPGPVDHKPAADDPDFEKLEPNSGIRLKERVLPHAALQDHLTGRYFLPPSLLYSVVRLQPNKQGYDVPVEGDWVTIAVVADRGDVKITSGPGTSTYSKRPEDEDSGNSEKKNNPERKKYVHLKLIDLGHRSRSSSSADSPRGTLRGDAQLSLLLFESDYYDKLIDKNGKKESVRKLWRGGSGGAFEECFPRLREGTVIALLNPKVLKPFANTRNPSPTSSILALTPSSASAVAVVGYAADLGKCTVQRRDGKPCGAWVDRRVNRVGANSTHAEDVCEYHIQAAVQRARSGRPEFSAGTSGMSTTANKRKATYDPQRQWGLKPEAANRGVDGETTYVVGGLVASSGRTQTISNVGEVMGREEQARARRKAGVREDKALSELLVNGKTHCARGDSGDTSREALAVVNRARMMMSNARKTGFDESETNSKGKDNIASTEGNDVERPQRKTYSAEMVKRLGFNPTAKPYGQIGSRMSAKKSDAINKLASHDRKIQLGPPPGPKVRSGVTAPPSSFTKTLATNTTANSATARLEVGTDDHHALDPMTCRPSVLHGTFKKDVISGASDLTTKVENDSDSDLEIEPLQAQWTKGKTERDMYN